MAGYYLIVGSGHSGSKWLAHVLNKPRQGNQCFHELKWKVAHAIGGWPAISRYEAVHGVNAAAFRDYWIEIRARLEKYGYVGDSNAFGSCMVPEAHAVQPLAAIIYLVRNGIQVVHSIATRSAVWRKAPLTSWAMGDKIRRYWAIAGRPYKQRWQDWTRWERTCLWWAMNATMPNWLREKLPSVPIHICRLEEVITHLDALATLLWCFNVRLPKPRLRRLQQRDINRKVKGDRRPKALWARWTPGQRTAFRVICGKAMETYGYRIPS